MLIEHECRQVANEPGRRWMSDDYFDLVIWDDSLDQVVGFQLCYDKPWHEHALTWMRLGGFSHARVDGGESTPFANCTPILVAAGPFPAEKVRREFMWRSGAIDPQIRELVLHKLDEYKENAPAPRPGLGAGSGPKQI